MQKTIILIFAIALTVFTMPSCNDNATSTVAGWWTIDTLIYKGADIKLCLLINVFEFKKNGDCDLPVPENRCSDVISEFNTKGNWKVIHGNDNPLSIRIDSKNKIFSGLHRIVFRDDKENGLLMMEIKSDSLYVVCRKGMFDYDHKTELVKELVNESNGNK